MYGVIETELFRPAYEIRQGRRTLYSTHPRPWVAQICGLDDKWGYQREFMRGVYDYTRTNNVGSRGTRIYYHLPPGIYEVDRPVTWRRRERFFCRVDNNGDIHKLTREEVDECLKSAT